MSEFTIDGSELTEWALAVAVVPQVTERELVKTTNDLSAFGVGIAQDLVRVDVGTLKGKILPDQATFAGGQVVGGYSVDMIYAAIHEYGGTITPKRGDFLVFMGEDGHLVSVRSVTITAQPYMGPSADQVEARMVGEYAKAIDRALAIAGVG